MVCGAENTESGYLNGFKRHFKKPTVSLKILEKPGSTVEVVRDAIGATERSQGDYDQVWCVVDVDQYRDFDEAGRLADEHEVRLAVSNPCFELWLLLHHADHRAHVADYKHVKSLWPGTSGSARAKTSTSTATTPRSGCGGVPCSVRAGWPPSAPSTRRTRPLECGDSSSLCTESLLKDADAAVWVDHVRSGAVSSSGSSWELTKTRTSCGL
ncbi:RloB family protein [Streptomyces xinghaiensis]|uniref:RloB family protein n=1 Tax=Streptomyces xinghaiensis TaxID=1038928 RepID=UPI00067C02E1